MTQAAWKNVWKEFDAWYDKKFDPDWKDQQKKIEELVEKYN